MMTSAQANARRPVVGLTTARHPSEETRRELERLAVVDGYIKSLPWSGQESPAERTLVEGNLRGFWSWLCANPEALAPISEGRYCRKLCGRRVSRTPVQ